MKVVIKVRLWGPPRTQGKSSHLPGSLSPSSICSCSSILSSCFHVPDISSGTQGGCCTQPSPLSSRTKRRTPIFHESTSITPYKNLIIRNRSQVYLYLQRKEEPALASVAQWIECRLADQRVTGSIPSQSTCLGWGPGPQ